MVRGEKGKQRKGERKGRVKEEWEGCMGRLEKGIMNTDSNSLYNEVLHKMYKQFISILHLYS